MAPAQTRYLHPSTSSFPLRVIYFLLVRRIPCPFSNSGIPISECVSLLFFLLLYYLDRKINLQCLPSNDPKPFSLHTAHKCPLSVRIILLPHLSYSAPRLYRTIPHGNDLCGNGCVAEHEYLIMRVELACGIVLGEDDDEGCEYLQTRCVSALNRERWVEFPKLMAICVVPTVFSCCFCSASPYVFIEYHLLWCYVTN
jgi:hypothetical protein